MCMDKGLVGLALRSAPYWEVEEYLKGKGFDEYNGGWNGIEVVWLPAGTRFTIEECDGSESVRTIKDIEMAT